MLADRDIAYHAAESIILLDADGKILSINPAAEALTGWPELAVVGKALDHLDIESSAGPWRHLLQEGCWHGRVKRRRLDGGHVLIDARRYLRLDGERLIGSVEYASASGATALIPAHAEDPDQSVAASWRIDVSPAFALIQTAADPAQQTDRAHFEEIVALARILDVNDRTVRLVGGNRGRDIMIGQSVAAFWPMESRADLGELIVQAVCQFPGKQVRRQLPSDGILRDPVFTVWEAGNDRPNQVYAAVHGIADDDRSYVFLRASEARYRKLTYFMPVALWQVDASHMGRIYGDLKAKGVVDFRAYLDEHPQLIDYAAQSVRVTDVNRDAIAMFGGASAQDLIRPIAYLFSESHASLRRIMVGRFTGRENYSENMKVRTLDDRILDVRLSVTYPAPRGELDTTIFSLEDITDDLRMQRKMRQLQADFSHAARIATLGELSSSIAHEVNQPLSAIVTYAETSLRWLARQDPNLAKATLLIQRVLANAQRADEIVQRVRAMAEKQSPEHAPLNLNDVVEEGLRFLRHEMDAHGVTIAASLSKTIPKIEGDRVQLQQVLINLIMNSLQATEASSNAEKFISVRTYRGTENAACICIRDNGPGIAEDDLGRIFEGFYTTKEKGMGIGLSIVRSIAVAHGGAITVSNHIEGGAEFVLTLPDAENLPVLSTAQETP
jgi:two-component system, LuxR family, sensor kinase FixL